MTTSFFVDGIPVAQGRPKFYRRGDHVGAYDPGKSKDWKSYVKMVAVNNGIKVSDKAIILSLSFQFLRPKSVKASKRPYHTVKPDLDNCTKAIKDALKGIAWVDDAQVCISTQSKSYADVPGVLIEIRELA